MTKCASTQGASTRCPARYTTPSAPLLPVLACKCVICRYICLASADNQSAGINYLEGEFMTSLTTALEQLREERRRAQQQVEQFDKAIEVIEGIASGNNGHSPSPGRRRKGMMSAAGRRRIAEAQRARWAKLKGSSSASIKAPGAGRLLRTMSAAARRKIAAAQRARWARFRQGKKTAA